MNALFATFLAFSDEPNEPGDLAGAAWRFVLPSDVDTVLWFRPGPEDVDDLRALDRVCELTVADIGTPTDGPPVDLVVGRSIVGMPTPPNSVSIDLEEEGFDLPFELLYENERLRGIVPRSDRSASALLDSYVGPVGVVRRTLSDRVKRRPVITRRRVVGSAQGLAAGPPEWLLETVRASGTDIGEYEWCLWCRGDYASQKLVLFLLKPGSSRPSLVAKITRDSRFNDRLENESSMLGQLGQLGAVARGRAPELVAQAEVGGSHVSVQTAVAGTPLRPLLARRPELLAGVGAWMAELANATAQPVERDELKSVLDHMIARYLAVYDPPDAVRSALDSSASILCDTAVFSVVQHGDPGPWNALLTDDDRVAFLDWEAGERRGLPLFDLLYFLRSACLTIAPPSPWESRRQALRRHLVGGSDVGDEIARHIRQYVDATGLDDLAIEPLYHFCWVHRAIKEARRLPPERRSRGGFHGMLVDGVTGRDRPGMRALTGRAATHRSSADARSAP